MNALNKIRKRDRALKYQKQVETLAEQQEDPDNTLSLRNTFFHTLIYKFIQIAKDGSEEDVKAWLDHMISYPETSLKERPLFISLGFALQDDMDSALRALQELDPKVDTGDVQLIRVLHHLFDEEPKQALEQTAKISASLTEIDRLWLKRKILSLVGQGSEEALQAVEYKLRDLIPGLTSETMDEGFEKNFDRWLKYMKRYYE